jgi:hypothetical protein
MIRGPKIKEDMLLRMRLSLAQRPSTPDELSVLTGLCRRTVYRYLDLLVQRGYDVRPVDFRRPTKYTIEGPGATPDPSSKKSKVW